MKIVHITNFYQDDSSYQQVLLPKYHAKLGNEVFLITSKENQKEYSKKIKNQNEYVSDSVKISRVKTFFTHLHAFYLSLKKKLKIIQPDFIFIHGLNLHAIATASKYKNKYPQSRIAIDFHNDFTNAKKSDHSGTLTKLNRKFMKIFIKRHLKFIDIFYPISPQGKQLLMEDFEIPESKIKILPLGIDIEQIKQMYNGNILEAKRHSRDLLKLNRDSFIVGTIGRIYPYKKIEEVIKAVKELNNPNIRLLISGKGDEKYENYLKKITNENENITFVGWLEKKQMNLILTACDIMVWPDSQSVLILQSLGCGTPVLINKKVAASYYKKHSNCVFTLEKGDFLEIKDKIKDFFSNKKILNECKNNIECTQEFFSYYRIARISIEYAFRNNVK